MSSCSLYNLPEAVVDVNKIKDLRTEAGMTQAELAKRMSTTNTTISKYELGQRDLDSATIGKLCDVFGCTADYLLGRSAVATPELTPEEESLLQAWRRCDDRARDMVTVALAPFREDESSAAAI